MNKTEICAEFEIEDFDGIVIAGETEYADYEGAAAIVFVNDGKLYFQSGSHCSCFGFEGQWSPEETSVDALKHIASNGYGIEAKIAGETIKILETFGMPTDPDAIAAAVQLYFGSTH